MNKTLALLTAGAALALAGCSSLGLGAGPTATATLAPTTGNSTSGTVRFVQSGDKVQVSGEIRGLKPGAEHTDTHGVTGLHCPAAAAAVSNRANERSAGIETQHAVAAVDIERPVIGGTRLPAERRAREARRYSNGVADR